MDTNSKQRFTFWVIVALAIMNVGTLGTIWFMQSNDMKATYKHDSKKNKKDHSRMSKHIIKELGLTEVQAQQFETEKNAHFEAKRVSFNQKKVLNKALFQALRTNNVLAIEAIKADLIALEQKNQTAFIKHLQIYQTFLDTEQQDKLFEFFEKKLDKKSKHKRRH